jgi:hypothetical protein
MQTIKYWEGKIKEKRKNTEFRDFVKSVPSWFQIMFYKNDGLISRFPESPRIKNIFEVDTYNKNYGDGVDGIEYDFSKKFFENFSKVFINIPKMATIKYGNNENCDYTDTTFWAKDSYLSICIWVEAENILYSALVYTNVKNVLNSVHITLHSENIYFCFQVSKSFNIFYSKNIANSSDIWFSSNLIGCSECIFCDDLENQKYCIENKNYEKAEYLKKKKEILRQKDKFLDFYKKYTKKSKNLSSKNCSWQGISFSSSVENAFIVERVTNWKNVAFSDGTPLSENIYDCFDITNVNDAYWWMWCWQWSNNMYIWSNASSCSHIYYSYFMWNCSFCLWCVGLKNKSFCILNKQYSKEEWYELADKIFAFMEKDGILGGFFPWELNPFYFNDTMAYLIDDSFTKEEVEKEGFMWRKEKVKVDIPEGAEVVYTKNPPVLSDIPLIKGDSQSGAEAGGLNDYQGFDSSGNWKINPEILKKVIVDKNWDYYKIIPMEYDFLMKYELPLPEIHWLERIKLGFKFNK